MHDFAARVGLITVEYGAADAAQSAPEDSGSLSVGKRRMRRCTRRRRRGWLVDRLGKDQQATIGRLLKTPRRRAELTADTAAKTAAKIQDRQICRSIFGGPFSLRLSTTRFSAVRGEH
jgi:hypothetical protein